MASRFQFFSYRVSGEEEPAELNHFLAAHRVLSCSHYFVPDGENSQLVFVVEYLFEGGYDSPKG